MNLYPCTDCGGMFEASELATGMCYTCRTGKPAPAKRAPVIRWARDYDECVKCGTRSVTHEGYGLCRSCHSAWKKNGRKTRRGAPDLSSFEKPDRAPGYPWSMKYPQCVACGTQKIKHEAHGLCRRCYKASLRKQVA